MSYRTKAMEQGRPRKGSSAVDADNEASTGSFSFAMPSKASSKGSQEFSSIYSSEDSSKDTPADVLFHNGLLVPMAYKCPSRKDTCSRNSSTNSKDSASRSSSNGSTRSRRNSMDNQRYGSATAATHPPRPRRATQSMGSAKELSFRAGDNNCSIRRGHMQKQVKQSDDKSWFESFTSSCRVCHALEPSAVKQGVIQQNVK